MRLFEDDGRPLTKSQRRLAQLLRRVETLRAERGRKEARWEKFLKIYPERILPEEQRMIARRKQVVMLLAETWRKPKGLGSLQRDHLEALLRGHLEELRASSLAVFDDGLRTLWSELNPEACEQAEEEAAEGGEARDSGPEPRRGGGYRDARSMGATDAGRDEARKRTMAVIYKQLAKALHPDLEQDPQMQARKQTLMQELTKANREGDLHTLLRLEMDWLTREAGGGDLRGVGEEKLGIYVELLEEQIEELQTEVREVPNQPRFAAVARFMNPTGEGPDEVERILLSIRQSSAALKSFRDALVGPDGRQALRLVLAEVGEQAERRAAAGGWDGAF